MLETLSQTRGALASIMPKTPEISVGIRMERSVSVSSDRNIRDHSGGGPLTSVGIFRPKFVVPFLTNRFLALIGEFGKGVARAIPIDWPQLIGLKCISIFLGYIPT